jgi:hypothetical protein
MQNTGNITQHCNEPWKNQERDQMHPNHGQFLKLTIQ